MGNPISKERLRQLTTINYRASLSSKANSKLTRKSLMNPDRKFKTRIKTARPSTLMINQTVNNKESHSLSIHHTITKMRSSITALLTAQVPSGQSQLKVHKVENRDWPPHTSLKRCVCIIHCNLFYSPIPKESTCGQTRKHSSFDPYNHLTILEAC